jgi:hypothetical protein
MEEKLKTFGELLQETIGQRMDGGDEIKPVDDPVTLDDSERTAILEKLVTTKPKSGKTEVKQVVTETTGEDLSKVPFGELLERTIKARADNVEEDNGIDEEIREAVMEKSKMDMVGDLMSRFMR